jgi:multiple sugar transport system substrate-binding protein
LKEAAAPYKGVTLNILTEYHPSIDTTEPFIKEFENETGIKVIMDKYRWQDMITKQEMELASGSSHYDIMFNAPYTSVKYHKAGWAEPLEKYIKDPKLTSPSYFNYGDHFESFVNLNRAPDGTLVGLPYSTETALFYYRTDLFDAAGIKEPPKTWEELDRIAPKLHKPPGHYAFVTRGRAGAGMNMSIWAAFLWSYGGRWFDSKMNPQLDSPQSIAGTNMYINLLKKWAPPGIPNYGVEEAYTDFAQGKVAMYYESSVWLGLFNDPKRSKIVGKFRVAPIPKGPHGDIPYPYPTAHSWLLPKTSKNKEAAWFFMQWFNSKEIVMRSALTGQRGDVPLKSVMADARYNQIYNKEGWADAFAYSGRVAIADYRPIQLAEYFEVGDRVGLSLSQILLGQKTTEVAMKEANTDVANIMRRAGTLK